MKKHMTHPKVDEFLAKANRWKAEFEKLRAIALDCGLTEEFKWAKPCYTIDDANVVILVGFKEHCALLFPKGALLKETNCVLIRPTENTQAARQVRFGSVAEINEQAAVIKATMLDAIDIEKSGRKVAFKDSAEFDIPEEFQQQLDAMPALKAAYAALTPGRRRGYLLHFSAPKQAKTRASRVEKCIPKILEGKGIDDR
jgi:uncharacterized protein YdeI (YjbR/CyaY-like superfamily)